MKLRSDYEDDALKLYDALTTAMASRINMPDMGPNKLISTMIDFASEIVRGRERLRKSFLEELKR